MLKWRELALEFLKYKQASVIQVGLVRKETPHILQGIYSFLDKKEYIPARSASACTTMTKSQRIAKERRKFCIGQRVYKVVDELRLNYIVHEEQLRKQLVHVKGSIQVVQAFLTIRQHPKFIELLQEQQRLVTLLTQLALKRSRFMHKVSFYEQTILSYLYKENLHMDKLLGVDLAISQFCMEYGVSGDIFHKAGKLVGALWGHTTRQLLQKVGKD